MSQQTDHTHYFIRLSMIVLTAFLFGIPALAADASSWLRRGNAFFEEGNYPEAERAYREALELDASGFKAMFNLGNALYKQGRLEEAAGIFESLSLMPEARDEMAGVLHNLGNARLGKGDIAASIEAYKDALRTDPGDEETRYNLAYALRLLEEMPPPEPQSGGDPEGEQDEGEEQEEGTGEDDPGDEGDDRDQEMAGAESNGPDQEDTPLALDQISREDAESLLDALRRQEQEVQEKINRDEQPAGPRSKEREW